MSIKITDWKWFGHPGHFCAATNCRFHLCTQVGKYLVSTVGDYYPGVLNTKRVTLGAGEDSFFETYIFNIKGPNGCVDPICGCGMPDIDFMEIEGHREATAGAAQQQHLKMCAKYGKKKQA